MAYEYKVHWGIDAPLCGHSIWSDNMLYTMESDEVTCKDCQHKLAIRVS